MSFAWEFLKQGGVWMIPIVASSVVVGGLVIERALFWWLRALNTDKDLRNQLLDLKLEPEKVSKSGDAVSVVYYEYLRRPFDTEGAKNTAEAYLRECRRHHGAIQMISGLATSLGLFGTVIGISLSFQGFSIGNMDAIIEGLATALNTTVVGLIVYVSGTLSLAYFEARADRETERVEDGMNRIRSKLLDRQRSQTARRTPAKSLEPAAA